MAMLQSAIGSGGSDIKNLIAAALIAIRPCGKIAIRPTSARSPPPPLPPNAESAMIALTIAL